MGISETMNYKYKNHYYILPLQNNFFNAIINHSNSFTLS
jgi:hypothetical protein